MFPSDAGGDWRWWDKASICFPAQGAHWVSHMEAQGPKRSLVAGLTSIQNAELLLRPSSVNPVVVDLYPDGTLRMGTGLRMPPPLKEH